MAQAREYTLVTTAPIVLERSDYLARGWGRFNAITQPRYESDSVVLRNGQLAATNYATYQSGAKRNRGGKKADGPILF